MTLSQTTCTTFKLKQKSFGLHPICFSSEETRFIFEFVRESLAVQWPEFVGFTHMLVKDTPTALCLRFSY